MEVEQALEGGGSVSANMTHILVICVAAPLSSLLFISERKIRNSVFFLLAGMFCCSFVSEVNSLIRAHLDADMFCITTSITPITEKFVKMIPVLVFALVFSEKQEDLLPNAFFVGIGSAVLENLVLLTQNFNAVTLFWSVIRRFSSELMHGIWYMPLKGAILHTLYPVSGMREMADNDVLYDSTRQGGTGIRSLLDCYVYCKVKGDALDWAHIEAQCETLGIAAFWLDHAGSTYYPVVDHIEDLSKDGLPNVLRDVDLEIRKGEYVAFTGHSGCGKSTVLKLLMGIYPLDSGARTLTDIEGTRPLTPAWHRLFAYVSQGLQLMSGTIREVVAFADRAAMHDEERLSRALSIACADEFDSALEAGVDTLLGERGTGLSEGQMQRLAIARAVFSDSPILLLDEATSALDGATEQHVLEDLRDMTDKTVVIVTHRPAALSICTRVIDCSQWQPSPPDASPMV